MWVEKVLGNVGDAIPTDADILDITWEQCGRLLKTRSRSDELVHVLLSPGQRIGHGDVLGENPLLIVNLLPCQLVIARPESPEQFARLAFELGNLHHPAQISESQILFPPHPQANKVLEALKVPHSIESRRFVPTRLIVTANVGISKDLQVVRRGSPANKP
jgi:urease accessory protein